MRIIKYIIVIFALPVLNIDAIENTEELLSEFVWNSSYPIDTVSMLYYENLVPGEAYDGETTFETVRVVHDDHLSDGEELDDQITDHELINYFSHTRVRKLYVDNRNKRNWIRLDSIWIPNERKGDLEYINQLFNKSQILIDGPKGYFRYESNYGNGMIHRNLNIKYPKIWQWGLIKSEGRERSVREIQNSKIYDKLQEVVNRNSNSASVDISEDNVFTLTLTPLFYTRTFVLRKDWNFLPTKATYKKNEEIQLEYEIDERAFIEEEGYFFPTKALERNFVFENEENLVDYELKIEVIDFNIWCDIPEAVFNIPFEDGARVIDMSHAVENQRPERLEWSNENSTDFLRSIKISQIDKIEKKPFNLESTDQTNLGEQTGNSEVNSSSPVEENTNIKTNEILPDNENTTTNGFLYWYALISPFIIIFIFIIYKKLKK